MYNGNQEFFFFSGGIRTGIGKICRNRSRFPQNQETYLDPRLSLVAPRRSLTRTPLIG